MSSNQNQDEQKKDSVFATPKDFESPEFHRRVELADHIFALDVPNHRLEFLWGGDVAEDLAGRAGKKFIYVKIGLDDTDELERIRDVIYRIKGVDRHSIGSESPSPNGGTLS